MAYISEFRAAAIKIETIEAVHADIMAQAKAYRAMIKRTKGWETETAEDEETLYRAETLEDIARSRERAVYITCKMDANRG